MNDFTKRTNAALRTNPNTFAYPESADVAINTHGSDWYWAVCALMATAFLTVATLSFFVPRKDRIFHYITATLLLTASISYFTMASNLGYAAIGVEFHRTSPETMGLTRQVFYVRYIDWVITTPVCPHICPNWLVGRMNRELT
jgi:bacteriorhodopsin